MADPLFDFFFKLPEGFTSRRFSDAKTFFPPPNTMLVGTASALSPPCAPLTAYCFFFSNDNFGFQGISLTAGLSFIIDSPSPFPRVDPPNGTHTPRLNLLDSHKFPFSRTTFKAPCQFPFNHIPLLHTNTNPRHPPEDYFCQKPF